MNTFQTVVLASLLGNTALAVFVLAANPKRSLNRSFAILATLVFLWLGSMFFGTLRLSGFSLLFWTRQTSAIASFIPLGVSLIYIVVAHRSITILTALYKLRFLLFLCMGAFILCHSPVFILSADRTTAWQTVPTVEYGSGFALYILFFLVVIVTMTAGFRNAYKHSQGVQKEELMFLQIGGTSGLVFGVGLLSSGVFLNYQEVTRFMPFSVLVLDGFIAYGIATRRILSAPIVLQRFVAYALMLVYLTIIYIVAQWFSEKLFMWLLPDTRYLSHLLAALTLAFSVSPAHGWMQAFARNLLPHATPLNADQVLEQSGHIFQEVSSENDVTEVFARLITRVYDSEYLSIWRPAASGDYMPAFFFPGDAALPLQIEAQSALIQLLKEEGQPVTVEMLQRMRPSLRVVDSLRTLENLDANAIVGCFARKEIKALILLSSRKTGRIYDLHDQRTLQLICDQFAVALENSSLYTAVQNAKIYNEILLDSLTSGIVAVNAQRMVTVFNQRAQDLTGLAEAEVIGEPAHRLPPALATAAEMVLEQRNGFRDRDIDLTTKERTLSLRVSGSLFHGHTGSLLGVLLTFSDMTELKQMEEQIRRSDRLSSIGTLSAGMAHEIKNPLVTIKTFTQLLPEQYLDEEFRQTFFALVGKEVQRIDTIVTRLLNFARPTKATLKPLSLHDVINDSLQLIRQRLDQKNIEIHLRLDPEVPRIHADADQLSQALINFFLNAANAMNEGGTLTVRTLRTRLPADTSPADEAGVTSYVRLDIEDTGCGISEKNLNSIFDPFFTTREEGVGLGLSVSHGIIEEHHGTIHVESVPKKGTVFHIHFPIPENIC